jgi:hypothetical protein
VQYERTVPLKDVPYNATTNLDIKHLYYYNTGIISQDLTAAQRQSNLEQERWKLYTVIRGIKWERQSPMCKDGTSAT